MNDNKIKPFYFREAPEEDLPSPSAIAIINPADVGVAELPDGWGKWEDAVEI